MTASALGLAIDWRAVSLEHQGRHPRNTSHTDEWDDDEREIHAAVTDYKEVNRKPFPGWSEIVAIFRALGWRKDPGAPRYDRSGPAPLPRGQRKKPDPIPFPKRQQAQPGREVQNSAPQTVPTPAPFVPPALPRQQGAP